MYYTILADFIRFFSEETVNRELITTTQNKKIWDECLEKESVPRRYITAKDVFDSLKKDKNSS